MAREAVLRDEFGGVLVKRRFTCATSTAIPKHTFLKLSADQTAAASVGTGDLFIGFAHADINTSTDSSFNTETSVGVDKGAIYELVASGSISLGQIVKTAAPGNYVMAATSTDLTTVNVLVGKALEAGSAGETINVEVFA